MVKEFKKGENTALSQNFTTREFDCKGKGCCEKTLIDTDLVSALQQIRAHFGKAVIINSGFRCEKHNSAVGGARSSLHKKGQAADIQVKTVEPIEVARYAESIGVKGIGLYYWGCHIDTREYKCFWYSDNESPRETFLESSAKISVLEWQKAAIKDGFKFSKYGADGKWGSECAEIAQKAICKKRLFGFKNKNLTKLVQAAVGVTADGLFGKCTQGAVKNYQRSQNLSADGIVGLNTWKRMLGVAK